MELIRMSERREHREQVSTRLDPDVIAVVDEVCAAERRTRSALLSIVVSDWAAARGAGVGEAA
jgi:predicted transcriptional regulator